MTWSRSVSSEFLRFSESASLEYRHVKDRRCQ